MKKKRILFFIFLAFLLTLILFWILLSDRPSGDAPDQYSVILYQYTDNDWDTLLEGIRQAEEDENVVVNYVTMPSNGTPDQELELIYREIANGASGILLAPVDSAALADTVRQIGKSVPVVTLETGLGDDRADISADNYAMGQLLGRQVAEQILAEREVSGEKAPEVCVIEEYTERESVRQRLKGFLNALGALVPDADVQPFRRAEGDYDLSLYISYQYANSHPGAYLVALDKYCTESLIDASQSYTLTTRGADAGLFSQRAFGIGNTLSTVSGLDAGAIRGLVYQNEFNIGYQGLQMLIEKANTHRADPVTDIDYYYVTRDVLYEPEHQRLLFPLI